MTILFLSQAVVLQYILKPISLHIVARSIAFEAQMKVTDGSDKLYPVLVKQERNIQSYFSEMAEVCGVFALASLMFSLAMAYNAFHFHKAYKLIPPDEGCLPEKQES